ncbi:MAG: DUF937 domain-containing protein [Hyphomicrobiaceae bacterium]
MRLSEELQSNEPVLHALARSSGLDIGEVRSVVAGVLPALAAAVERNTLSRGGLADLVAFLGQGAPDRLLDEPEWIADPARSMRVEDYGVAALDLLLGSKDRSRAIAEKVQRETGVDATAVRGLMPAIAAVAMGGVRRDTASAFGDIFGNRNDGGGPGGAAPPPGPGGDIPEQAPLPLPGELPRGGYEGGGYRRSGGGFGGDAGEARNPYDDLSDILRRGGFGGDRPTGGSRGGGTTVNVPGGGAASGGVLWSIVREVIGAVLGFRSRGIVGWIIRAVVLRYGWQIAQAVFRRLVLGR